MSVQCHKCDTENTSDSRFCKSCATPLPPSENISSTRTVTLQTSYIELTRGGIFDGRYQVVEELGRGGMGRVYRAIDMKIDEEVALKLLKPEVAADKSRIERFRNELKFSRKISHKNVCRMYHLGEVDENHYITMEYVPGEDLKSTLRRVGPLSQGKAIHIANQACEGLAEAHKFGVVHRDLKPHNIMIDREGNVRIMDFGIARSVETTGITGSGVMIGTPDYMSPEQVEGKKADRRSDIYSLGVIIYEMVTGKLPFEGETAISVALKHKTEKPLDPRMVNPQISEELSRVILKCMEKNKEKRYQEAKGLLSELTNIEKNLPSTDRVHSKGKTWLRTPKKRLKPLFIPGILILLAIIIIGGYFYLGKKPQAEKTEKVQKSAVTSEKVAQKTEALTPQNGQLEIASTPAGAEVYLDGKREGVTPFKRELPPENYKIRIRKPGYKEITDALDVEADETSSKKYTLSLLSASAPPSAPVSKPVVYTLSISTLPEGADVSIDDKDMGKTPIRIDLPRRSCQLKLERGEEWSTVDERLTLKPGTNSFHRDLKRIKYSLSIITNPSGAEVLLNNKPFGTTPVNKLVSIGTHDMKIEMQDYKTIEDTINVDSDVAKTYDLTKPKKGKIRIKVQPYADVLIDGKLIGEVPPIRIQEVLEGKHTIEFVSTRLNKKYVVEVDIGPGESKEVRMNMETGEKKVVRLNSEREETPV